MSVIHAVSRSVRDSAALLDATAGPEPGQTTIAPAPKQAYLEQLDTARRGIERVSQQMALLQQQYDVLLSPTLAPQGLPVGVMFAGRYGEEGLLFQLAGQLEQASPWFNKLPPV